MAHSLVAAGVVALLRGEAVHAADDPAVEGGPVLAANLPPLAPVLDLHKPLCDGHPLPLGVGGPDAHVLHLHRHVLEGGGLGTHMIGWLVCLAHWWSPSFFYLHAWSTRGNIHVFTYDIFLSIWPLLHIVWTRNMGMNIFVKKKVSFKLKSALTCSCCGAWPVWLMGGILFHLFHLPCALSGVEPWQETFWLLREQFPRDLFYEETKTTAMEIVSVDDSDFYQQWVFWCHERDVFLHHTSFLQSSYQNESVQKGSDITCFSFSKVWNSNRRRKLEEICWLQEV